jgi:hypothetical protein
MSRRWEVWLTDFEVDNVAAFPLKLTSASEDLESGFGEETAGSRVKFHLKRLLANILGGVLLFGN